MPPTPLDIYRLALAAIEGECQENRRRWPLPQAIARAAVAVPLRRLIALLEVEDAERAVHEAHSVTSEGVAMGNLARARAALARADADVRSSTPRRPELVPVSDDVEGETVVDLLTPEERADLRVAKGGGPVRTPFDPRATEARPAGDDLGRRGGVVVG